MDEHSKADVIKEAIKQMAKPVQDFIKQITGPPAQELGEWMADGVRGYRFNTQLRIYSSAMEKLNQANLSPKRVNLKILVPLLENGSLEEEDSMIEMWASLLANASSESDSPVFVSYPSILKEISSMEATILDVIYTEVVKNPLPEDPRATPYVFGANGEAVRAKTKLSLQDFEQYVDNLYRLRLLAPPSTRLEFIDKSKDTPFMLYTKKAVCLTYLGYNFMQACKPPQSRP